MTRVVQGTDPFPTFHEMDLHATKTKSLSVSRKACDQLRRMLFLFRDQPIELSEKSHINNEPPGILGCPRNLVNA